MRTLFVVAGIATGLALGAAQAAAQAEYYAPRCELNKGYFLVSQSIVYLKGAFEEKSPEKRDELIASARRNLIEALVDRAQTENAAVWYFLGRTYTLADDPIGADSAFTRAEELAPDCAQDIGYYRQIMWVTLINEGVDSLRAGAFEGAKELYRLANTINRKDNVGFYYMARIFGNEGEFDSAAHYFKKVVEIGPADTARKDNYDQSVLGLAELYRMDMEWDSAATWYEKYREMYPTDTKALIDAAEAYSRVGAEARALIMYDTVLIMAADMDASSLFSAGQALFVAGQFERAAKAFELGLEKNPYSRTGLADLANTHLAVASDPDRAKAEQDGAARKLEKTARQLVEVDPHNRETRRLLAAAYQLLQKNDAADAAMGRLRNMKFEVIVDLEQSMNGGYVIQGRITNLGDAGITVPQLTFEFLDAEGNIVTTETLSSLELGSDEATAFTLTPQGEEITAYRYK